MDGRFARHAALPEVPENDVFEAIVAEYGGKGDISSSAPHMFGDYSCAADKVYLSIEPNAKRRSLCVSADQSTVGAGVNDSISDSMYLYPIHLEYSIAHVFKSSAPPLPQPT